MPPSNPNNNNDYLNENLLQDNPPSYNDSQTRNQRAPRPPLPPAPKPTSLLIPVPPPTLEPVLPQALGSRRLVVAIDFGTTFTGLAQTYTHSDRADLSSIEVLQDWTLKMGNQQKVSSVISYSRPSHDEEQWGSDVSDNATTMVNQKLELELQDSKLDELDLTLHLLKGTGSLAFGHIRDIGKDPEFTGRAPEDIITDYLNKIYKCACKVINAQRLARTNTPADFVITVPANWSYTAHSAIFKAFRRAGFNRDNFSTLNSTLLVSEPEAASYFTALDLQGQLTNFLQKGDCFILCDAGGGTVDVVSLQAKQLTPFLLLEKATMPTGAQCGSSWIDTAFKIWLRKTVGKDIYTELDPESARLERISPHALETGAMRELMKRFNVKKAAFSNAHSSDIKIDMPQPLDTLNIDGRVHQGEITIHRTEMKAMMDYSVNKVIELIDRQICLVSEQHRLVKSVCLVGGFGASPYLQEELRETLDMRRIRLRRPNAEKSLTAVVQGGVIFGVEKARHKDATYMAATTASYGVVVEGRFQWLVKQGDLVVSNKDRVIVSRSFSHSAQSCIRSRYDFSVYRHIIRDVEYDCAPDRWQNGQNAVEKVYDLAPLLEQHLRPDSNQTNTRVRNIFSQSAEVKTMQWRFTVSSTSIGAEVLSNESRIARSEIPLDVDWPRQDGGSAQSARDEDEDEEE